MGWQVASDIAVIATGQAVLAFSFIVPKKPQASFWVAGIVVVVMVFSEMRCDNCMNTLFGKLIKSILIDCRLVAESPLYNEKH